MYTVFKEKKQIQFTNVNRKALGNFLFRGSYIRHHRITGLFWKSSQNHQEYSCSRGLPDSCLDLGSGVVEHSGVNLGGICKIF